MARNNKKPDGSKSIARHKWTRAQLAMLGKKYDAVIAAKLGVSVGVVMHMRMKLRIPALQERPPRLKWQSKHLRMLGKVPDTELSAITGFSRKAIIRERLRRDIPSYAHSQVWHAWTKEEIALLGTDTDQAIADKLGLNLPAVAAKRAYEGIASAKGNPRKIAEDFWTEEKILTLGSDVDRKVATMLGVSISTVVNKRTALGIPAHRKHAEQKMKETDKYLGKVPDAVIAKKLGITRSAVAFRRKTLGIASFREYVKHIVL